MALVPAGREDLIAEVKCNVEQPGALAAALQYLPTDEVRDLASRIGVMTWEDVLEEIGADRLDLLPDLRRSAKAGPFANLSVASTPSAHGPDASDIASLTTRFIDLRNAAPHRHSVGKRYLVGHTGVTASGEASTRGEEHLAVALFNRHGTSGIPLDVAGGPRLRFLDYQVPLKARQTDAGVGKVDLLALNDDGRLVVIELKAGTSRETVTKAAWQVWKYAALISANQSDIAGEIAQLHGVKVSNLPPTVVVAAPAAWWRGQKISSVGTGSNLEITAEIDQLSKSSGSPFLLIDLGDVEAEMGLDGAAPRLLAEVAARAILTIDPK
ncbi:MAG: hypothetical protein ABIO70_08930 [Pseudomonadota bacterium]